MSTAVAQLAKGITVSFSNLTGDLIDIDDAMYERGSVDVTHQASGSYREKLEGAFADQLPITLVLSFHYSVNPTTLITASASTFLVTFPTPSGLTNPPTLSVSAFCSKVGRSSKLGEKIVLNVEITPKGEPTYTPAS